MGKTPRVLRTRDELGRLVTVGSVMTSSQLGQLVRPVAYRAAHGGVPSSRYVGCPQGRDSASGWAGEEVSAHGREEKWKGLFIFQIFSKFQTNFEFKSDLNFDDFYSQNKM
jgi:hypothetical protein